MLMLARASIRLRTRHRPDKPAVCVGREEPVVDVENGTVRRPSRRIVRTRDSPLFGL
jgi:hypothetical protein